MAKKTVFVSDLSGEMIEEGKGAKVRITYVDARRGVAELDVTDKEADEIAQRGRRVARRGAKAKGRLALEWFNLVAALSA